MNTRRPSFVYVGLAAEGGLPKELAAGLAIWSASPGWVSECLFWPFKLPSFPSPALGSLFFFCCPKFLGVAAAA